MLQIFHAVKPQQIAGIAISCVVALTTLFPLSASAGAPVPGVPPATPKPIMLKTGSVEQNVFSAPQKKKRTYRRTYRKTPRRSTAKSSPVPRRSVIRRSKPRPLIPQKPLNLSNVPDVRSNVRRLIKLGNVKSADWLLKKAIEVSPDEEVLTNDLADLSLERAKKLIAAGYLECALIRLREALFLNPDLAEARELLNEVLTKLGKDPTNPDERLKMASELVGQNRYVAAIVEYRESLALRPSVQGYMGLAEMYNKSQQPALAQAALNEAHQLDPGNAILQRKLASMGQFGANASFTNGATQANQNVPALNVLNPATNQIERSKAGRILVNLWHGNSMDKYTEFYKKSAPALAKTPSGAIVPTASPLKRSTPSAPAKPRGISAAPGTGYGGTPVSLSGTGYGGTPAAGHGYGGTPASRAGASASRPGGTSSQNHNSNDGFDLPSWYSGPPVTAAPGVSNASPRSYPASASNGNNAVASANSAATQPQKARWNGNGYGASDALHPVESERGSWDSMGPEGSGPVQSGPKVDQRAVPTRGGLASFDPEELRQQMSNQSGGSGSGSSLAPISNSLPAGQVEDCACDPAN
jgi:hypothetical protein